MSPDERNDPAFEALLEFLRNRRGFDFTGYKRSSLRRRIDKRMSDVGVEGYEEYVDYLEVHPPEFARLFNTILINVTRFFRDPESWDVIAADVIPEILEGKGPEDPIRLWVPGCASGEEAYSLAILFAEALGIEAFVERVKLYASDVDEDSLAEARTATYPPGDLDEVPEAWRGTYFERSGSRYTVRDDLRRRIVFGSLDLVQDAPISRVDLITCRNTLMYFNTELQGRILSRFHFALREPGFLFLGSAEMLLAHAALFEPRDLSHRIFQKVNGVEPRDRLFVLPRETGPEVAPHDAERKELRESVFEAEPYAQVVVDENGRMAMANEVARSTFGLTRRDVGRPFQELDLSYRPVELRPVIREVHQTGERRTVEEVEHSESDRRTRYFDVLVSPIRTEAGSWLGVNVSFQDVTDNHRLREELRQSNQELETAYEELQSTNEELETTNEELQSTVEELETSNEELQSSNEELQTMNEELQSSNEELHTINDELRRRTDELAESNDFLGTLLASLNAGVIIVDQDLYVVAWNRGSEDLWGLRADEANGAALEELDIGLPVAKIRDDVVRCTRGEIHLVERELEAIDRRGKTIDARARIMPFVEEEGARKGAVILVELVPG